MNNDEKDKSLSEMTREELAAGIDAYQRQRPDASDTGALLDKPVDQYTADERKNLLAAINVTLKEMQS